MKINPGPIVCAIDFSASTEATLDWATALARRWTASVELLNVLPRSEEPEALATDVRVVEKEAWASAKDRVEALARASEARSGVPVRGRVLQGDAPRIIVTSAREAEASLIVLGARGGSAIGRWLLGSVADRVIRAADRPVAVVPAVNRQGDDSPHHDLGLPWQVTAGLDLGPASERVVAFVDELMRRNPCQVTFLHLYWPPEQIERLGLRGVRSLTEPDPDIVANLEPRLRGFIGRLASDSRVKLDLRPAWGEPAGNILAAAQEQGADLLVVAAEERHGLSRLLHPSAAAAMAAHVRQVPVVCVPPPEKATSASIEVRTPRLSTVLAPTDLSPHGNRAVAYAYAVLRGRGGVVELCHIHEHALPDPAYAYEDAHGRLSSESVAAIEDELRSMIPTDAGRFGIATHVSVIDGGNAAKAILQAAERLCVDAISVGSHGRSGVARAVLGSVAEQVTRAASKPVLVVRAVD